MKALRRVALVAGTAVLALTPASANHSWGGYHWARTSNPFTVKLGDNVNTGWDSYLAAASSDWSKSTVLNTTVVAGLATNKRCRATSGRVEVCNASYGFNGWLGVASIWLQSGTTHITQGTVKLNDSYFNTATYNKPEWRQMVTCQEVGHTFGLDHQDENFNNTNLGTCMDYTNDPTGKAGTNGNLANTSPNQHDYDELDTIYSHLDSSTTLSASTNFGIRQVGQRPPSAGGSSEDDSGLSPAEWGRAIHTDSLGRPDMFVRDLGAGGRILTHVLWALDAHTR